MTSNSRQMETRKLSKEKLPFNLLKLADLMQLEGFSVFLVGGAVRDLILSKEPHDYDLVTNATENQLIALFPGSEKKGSHFKFVLVRYSDEFFEVATLKKRKNVDMGHADDQNSDNKKSLLLSSIFENSASRDFSINAMYYDFISGEIYDFHGGFADIEGRKIKVIGSAEKRFIENPLLMLRAVRFAKKFEFEIDENVKYLIEEKTSLLRTVSTDRLLVEIVRQLKGGHALATMQYLCSMNIQQELLPSLDALLTESDHGNFLRLALKSIDECISNGGIISNQFIFSALLWPSLRTNWSENCGRGMSNAESLHLACQTTILQQPEAFGLRERLGERIIEIWQMQIYFEKHLNYSLAPFDLIKKKNFLMGLNLLFLRSEAGEVCASIAKWWCDFFGSDPITRCQLTKQRSAIALL